jgi:hypothetical protein
MSASNLGIADLPMRLLVGAVVMSMMVPLVWSAYSDLSINYTLSSIETEIRDLFGVIEEVMDGGIGTTINHNIEISAWGVGNIEYLILGALANDTGSSQRYLASYSVSGYGSGFMSLDPPIPLLSPEGIRITEGSYELRITHGSLNGEHYCRIELMR